MPDIDHINILLSVFHKYERERETGGMKWICWDKLITGMLAMTK